MLAKGRATGSLLKVRPRVPWAPCRASTTERTRYPDRVCLPLSQPIGLTVNAQLRGTECYVAWRANVTGRLYLLSASVFGYPTVDANHRRMPGSYGHYTLGVDLGPQAEFPFIIPGYNRQESEGRRVCIRCWFKSE